MSRTIPKKVLSAILPQSTFWRFLIVGTAIAVLTIIATMAVARIISLAMIHELQEERNYAVLRSAVDQISRARIGEDSLRSFYMEQRKDILRRTVETTIRMLESYQRQVKMEGHNTTETRSAAFSRLNAMGRSLGNAIFVIDATGQLVVHPDPTFRGRDTRSIQDSFGEFIFRDLAIAARQAGVEGAFLMSNWGSGNGTSMQHKLAWAKYYPAWDITVCSDLSLDEMPEPLRYAIQSSFNELRARIGEIDVGKNGYVFVLDKNCDVIFHPTLTGRNIADMKAPGSEKGICQIFHEAADKQWGANKVEYLWDRPDSRGNFSFKKVAWATYEPATGWLVAITSYVDDLEEGLPRLMSAIFFPALGAILLLVGGLAFTIRNLLKPIENLSQVCRAVSQGDLDSQAKEDAPGEMGALAQHFNNMIQQLKELRENDALRRQELEELNEELERVVELRTQALKKKAHDLEVANRNLKELDAMKSSFLSSVSHELRTPLTSVLGFAKLISRDFTKTFWPLAPDDKARTKGQRVLDNLDIIRNEGERLTRLINDVLDIGKIESGRVDWHDRLVSMSELVTRAVQASSGQFADKTGLRLEMDVEDNLPFLELDFDRLVQVLVNLLNNAAKFTEQGYVRVTAAQADQVVRIAVEDTGMGVPEQELERVFEKFHQVRTEDTLTEKPKGTGLGLAICRQIVEHYGGVIYVRSKVGKGSTFVVELPLERTKPEVKREQPQEEKGQTRIKGDQALVLVADDDLAVNAYLTQLLEEMGFQTIQAFDGESALQKASVYQPDLVTMDIMMPVLDGRAAIRLMRQDERTSSIPVLVLSALQNLKDMGGDAALTKPIDENVFLSTVKGLLSHEPNAGPVLVLKYGAEGTPNLIYPMGQENTEYCTEEELWTRIKAGFQGAVLVPSEAVETFDLVKLSNMPGVHFMILPNRNSLIRRPSKG
jgi:signal transduction histidine kinase/CheY-like chemotaxis protein